MIVFFGIAIFVGFMLIIAGMGSGGRAGEYISDSSHEGSSLLKIGESKDPGPPDELLTIDEYYVFPNPNAADYNNLISPLNSHNDF